MHDLSSEEEEEEEEEHEGEDVIEEEHEATESEEETEEDQLYSSFTHDVFHSLTLSPPRGGTYAHKQSCIHMCL